MGKLQMTSVAGGQLGPHDIVKVGDRYIGHMYEDSSDDVNYDETLDAIQNRYNTFPILTAALRAIVARSNHDPLGTSKVNDMRRIAEEALKQTE